MSMRTKSPSRSNPLVPRRAEGAETQAKLARDPASAVSFVLQFSSQEGMPPDRVLAKLLLMRQGAGAFFRANPALFFADLMGAYLRQRELLDRRAPTMVIDGDTHLGNFRAFRGPDGHPVWGLDDFGQAGMGSPEWDLERLATSAVLAAREAGLGHGAQHGLVKAIGARYFGTIATLAHVGRAGPAPLWEEEASGPVKALLRKAESVRRGDLLKHCVRDDRFLSTDDLRPLSTEQAERLMTAMEAYARKLPGGVEVAVPLCILDAVEKLDGGERGYGLPRYYVLVAHADSTQEPILLEVKALLPSAIDEQDGDPQRADAAQVVEHQRTLGAAANPLTGSTVLGGSSYLVRELEPEKARVTPEQLSEVELFSLCEQAARVLARSHAQGPGQAEAIHTWVGDDAEEATANLWSFARAYADQVFEDWTELRDSTSA
ncbi:MAG TPA: DUF2252 family protein [Longimicrobium sp.]|nr:DUF2252 family protein [Longimicrobium sp.]